MRDQAAPAGSPIGSNAGSRGGSFGFFVSDGSCAGVNGGFSFVRSGTPGVGVGPLGVSEGLGTGVGIGFLRFYPNGQQRQRFPRFRPKKASAPSDSTALSNDDPALISTVESPSPLPAHLEDLADPQTPARLMPRTGSISPPPAGVGTSWPPGSARRASTSPLAPLEPPSAAGRRIPSPRSSAASWRSPGTAPKGACRSTARTAPSPPSWPGSAIATPPSPAEGGTRLDRDA